MSDKFSATKYKKNEKMQFEICKIKPMVICRGMWGKADFAQYA